MDRGSMRMDDRSSGQDSSSERVDGARQAAGGARRRSRVVPRALRFGVRERRNIALAVFVLAGLALVLAHASYAQGPGGPAPSGPSPAGGGCGDGVVQPGEACDPGLAARCSASCTPLPLLTPCVGDADCARGQVCGFLNASGYGAAQGNVCWPALCESEAFSSLCGDAKAPCGGCDCGSERACRASCRNECSATFQRCDAGPA